MVVRILRMEDRGERRGHRRGQGWAVRCFRRSSDGRFPPSRQSLHLNEHPQVSSYSSSSSPVPLQSPVLRLAEFRSRATTYTRELGAAVTALGGSAALLDVQNSEVTAGSLDDSGPVGASVVAAEISPVSIFYSVAKAGPRRERHMDERIRFDSHLPWPMTRKETHPLRRR